MFKKASLGCCFDGWGHLGRRPQGQEPSKNEMSGQQLGSLVGAFRLGRDAGLSAVTGVIRVCFFGGQGWLWMRRLRILVVE